MGEKFQLIFDDEITVETFDIDEPFGWDGFKLKLAQKDKKWGRDYFNGSSATDTSVSTLEFSKRRNHKFDHILYFLDNKGFEAKISLNVIGGQYSDTYALDFQTSETDGISSVTCALIQDTKLQLLKRREDVKVDLFATTDLDGNPIAPVDTGNLLIKSKPAVMTSTWSTSLQEPKSFTLPSESSFNFSTTSELFGIRDSLGFIPGAGEPQEFPYIQFVDNAEDIKIELTNVDVKIFQNVLGGGDVRLNVKVYDPDNISLGTDYVLDHKFTPSSGFVSFLSSYALGIPRIPRGHRIAIYFRVEGGGIAAEYTSMDVKISATTIGYNIVTPTVRIIDAMRQVCLSAAGLQVYAPRWDVGGELYDQRVFSKNMARHLTDTSFFVTLKDIEDWIAEDDADWEIMPDGTVFFGTAQDFYTDREIAFFPDTQFDSFKKTFNPRFAVNKFSLAYKEYQSQKENSEENTADCVHGESEWLLANKNVENNREAKIGYIRDPFSIRAALDDINLENNTATQDDDKVYVIDTYTDFGGADSLTFTETDDLMHRFDTDSGLLTITNTGNFLFNYLGTADDQIFIISSGQPNAGIYTVAGIGTNYLQLTPVSATPTTGNNGSRLTEFTYYVPTASLAGVNWTNQGITTTNIERGDNYGNLRFSLKSNILKYYNFYLSICNLYRKFQYISGTFYKNNPKASITYNALTVTEGDPFLPVDAFLTPVLYKSATFVNATLDNYIKLHQDIRTIRGFVRFIDNEGIVRRMYVQEMNYEPSSDTLVIERGEEKNEPIQISITTGGAAILVNNYAVSALKYEFDGDRVKIKDNGGYLLYNPTFYTRISINGATYPTFNAFKTAIQSI
jgi:hypothetical protein